MRKIIVVLLAGAVAVSLMGCGIKVNLKATGPTAKTTEQAVTEALETETTEEAVIKTSVAKAVMQETAEEPSLAAMATVSETTGSKLSDSIYSFQVSIDGDILQFPMKYRDLTAHGWKFEGADGNELVNPEEDRQKWFDREKLQLSFNIKNLDTKPVPLSECYVTGVLVDQSWILNGENIIMPGGIQLGVSTREDIKKAYGEPAVENNLEGGSSYYRYHQDTYQWVEFGFLDQENKVGTLNLNCQ